MDVRCVCMHKHARLGGVGTCFPRKILEMRCSEIASEAIWDKTRAVVATWLMKYCIQFLPVHICICYKPADFEFPREKVLRLGEQQVGDITR